MSFFRKKTRHPILRIILLLIVVGAVAFLYFDNLKKASAEWFDSSWFYRKSIPVTNNTTTETNVYISATIDTSDTTRFQGDCGDLRFTKINGQVLPYYISSGCTTASTVVHVKLDSFPAGAQTIYYYYGNPNAANGFSAADFSTVASNYTVGSLGTEEKGPAPVAYFRFDEGQGITAYDDSSNNNDGTLSGTTKPTWQTGDQCVSGKCLYFDGSNSYVSAPANSSINFNQANAFTVEAWVKSNVAGSEKYIINKQKNTTNEFGYTLKIASNGLFHFDVLKQNVSLTSVEGTTAVVSQWYHLVGVSDGTNISLYVNGNLQGSSTAIGFSAATQSVATLYLGQFYNNTLRWQGLIDDVKIYPYARTSAQVQADYNSRGSTSGTSVKVGNESAYLSNGLVGYWKMDEASGAGSTLADSSGAGNTGTASLWGGGNTATDSAHVVGKFGNSFSFDGGDDYIDVGSNTGVLDFTGTQAFTISAWINPNSLSSALKMIIGKNATAGSSYQYALETTSSSVGFYVGAGAETVLTDPGLLTTGTWYHVVGVTNGTTASVYINGKWIKDGTPTSMTHRDSNVFIGKFRPSGSQYFFNGSIDEVRIYNRALSSKEISDLYNWAPGPLGYWKMDDKVSGNSQTLVDSSTYANTGTTHYGANATGMNCKIIGKYGGGCLFDGVDDYVSAGTNASILPNAWTIEAWVYYKGGRSNILSFTNANYGTVGIGVNTGSGEAAIWMGANNHMSQNMDNGTFPTNVWTHVAFTMPGNAQTDIANAKIYINGVDKTGASSVSSGAQVGKSTVYIGATDTSADDTFNGSMDDVRIYNYARTQKQVLEDMNAGHPSVGSPVGSYAAWWKFDEGHDNTLYDQSVNANTITNSGAVWSNNGKFGKALSFDGISSFAYISNPSTSLKPATLTVSTWVNPTQVSDSGATRVYIVAEQPRSAWTDGRGYNLNIGSGKVTFEIGNAGGSWISVTGATTLSVGKWYHLVGTYDGANLKVYVNSVLDGTTASTATISYADSTGGPNPQTLYIGTQHNSNTTANTFTADMYFFQGLIDEVKIYPFALTVSDIQSEYNQHSAIVMGSFSDTSGLTGGSVASNSASAIYCIPGDTTSCNSPVAEWKFDEKVSGNSQTVFDTSGNGNNGTTNYGANLTGMNCKVLGKYATGCSFDGVDDYVDAGNSASLNLASGSLTIEFWAYIKSLADDKTIISSGNSGYYKDHPYMIVTHGSTLWYVHGDGTSTYEHVAMSPAPSLNTWVHAVVVKSGTNIQWYLNGATAGSGALSLGTTAGFSRLQIGTMNTGDWLFNGLLDDVKIFNYARTPAQVAWDYNRGGPVGWWKFDECQGTTAYDASGNGNTGTINLGSDGTQTTTIGYGTCTVNASTPWYNGRIGKFNSAINLDGTSDYVDAGNAASLNISTGDLTIETWVNSNLTASEQNLAGKGSEYANNPGYTLYKNADNTVTFELQNTSGTRKTRNSLSAITSGWHHIVGVRDQANNKMWEYVDGVSQGSTDITGLGDITPSRNFRIGVGPQAGAGWNFYWNGIIDEVKVFNYALTPQQILLDYNQGSAVRFGPTSGRP